MSKLRYGSVCSGIEAATVAWHPLGWEPQWFSEIETFPSAVLAHHYPNVPNLGDMTKLYENETFKRSTIDLLVGGTPCQSFSVAGLRKGLADPRGNLALEYLRLADVKQPRWLVWENVPGILYGKCGGAFGSFLGALGKLGYGFAYRVLDAQYFGVPQRRRRVFVVGHLGDWRRAAEVLFERSTLSEYCGRDSAFGGEDKQSPYISFGTSHPGIGEFLRVYHPMGVSPPTKPAVIHILDGNRIRSLTPEESEATQGFPRGYTALGSDHIRYKATGNSMAVPVMRWLGERINYIEEQP